MSEKYIDLHDEIADSIHWDATVADTLKWLDEHPDRAPARTITESELIQLWQVTVEGRNIDDFAQELKDNGITVVPDPEPTNRDRLQGWLVEFAERNASCGGERGDCDLAEFLDAHGVKAPGGD